MQRRGFNFVKALKLVLAATLFGVVVLSGITSSATPAFARENAQFETISFSRDSLVTGVPIQLALTNLVGQGTIKYTTNGSIPDANSTPYTGPLPINDTTVIRAQLFANDGTPVGNLYTKSYIFADYEQSIPVVSIVASWMDLNTLHTFPTERGIEWERPINLEYFEPDGQVAFNVPAGVRIHGNFSRIFSPKKSYRIYFRNDYGLGKLEYPMFEDSPVTKFDKLLLRAGFQDTFVHRGIPERSDRHDTAKFIADQVTRNLHRDMGQPVAHGKWVLLYLNGDFWGLYNLTERIDLQFLQSYSDENSDWHIISKESGWDEFGVWYSREEVKEGNYGAWLDNQNWIGGADFTIPGNIGELEWRVDLENVFSYLFLQAYVQNTDWPGANWIVYRRMDEGGFGTNEAKWRMMVWDAEDSFGGGEGGRADINTIVRVYSPHDSITRILEKPFIGNCGMKHRFVNRAREYLGVENPNNKPDTEVGQLSKERVKAEITKQADIVRPFIQMETNRWAPDLPGVDIFENNINSMLNFVDVREEVILHHLDLLRYQTFTECK